MTRSARILPRLAIHVASLTSLFSAACDPWSRRLLLQEAPSEAEVYAAVAAPVSGAPCSIVSYKSVSLPSLIPTKSWLIAYRSTDALDKPNTVSGTVIVPTDPWSGGGPRPIIAYAHGTVGVADDCAPSKTMPAGLFTEQGYVAVALSKGWAVALTDYEGLGTPGNDAAYPELNLDAYLNDAGETQFNGSATGSSAPRPPTTAVSDAAPELLAPRRRIRSCRSTRSPRSGAGAPCRRPPRPTQPSC